MTLILQLLLFLTPCSGLNYEPDWIGKPAPELSQGDWINSAPLTLSALRGKVVLLEFWTYGCYNCRNTLPYLKNWYSTYQGGDFEIIGVHTPEFESEKDLSRVQRNVRDLGISYPVVTDNRSETWKRYDQRYWPVLYLIDKKGIIRRVQIGEGGYAEMEGLIRALLQEEP